MSSSKKTTTSVRRVRLLHTFAPLFVMTSLMMSCGKVTNLSQQAGLVESATAPLMLAAQELLPISLGVPYKEIIAAQGGLPPYSYVIKKGSLFEGLAFDGTTGIITGQIDKSFAAQQSILTIEATDAGGLKAEQSYTLKTAAYTFAIAPSDIPVITPALNFAMKFNAVGAVEPVKYAISGALPLKLSLASDGALTTEAGGVSAASAKTQWPIEITATDANNVSASAKYILRVGEAPETAALSILSTQLYGVQVGVYGGGISTSGGVAPLTFTIEGGALPAGLTMNAATGIITGTIPSAAANAAYAVVIKVADASGQSVTKTFTGNVSAGNSTLVIHTATLSQMTASIGYNYNLAVSGGKAPYTYSVSSGSLPSGLALNTSSGLISGTLAAATGGNAYAFVITVTDADGQTAAKTYTGTVAASSSSSVSIVTTTLPTPAAGSSYLAAIGATGGSAPYTYSISAGSLPSGLSLNTSSGIISGTVQHAQKGAAYVFTVTVTDAGALTASQIYSGFVGSYTTAIVPAALTAATPGAAYSVGLATAGGEAPYTYTVTSGTLPVGLSLNSSTGVLSGTISQAEAGNTRNFTIKSTDANNVQASVSYALNINAFAVTLTTSSLANAVESAMYSNNGVNLAATGGTAPYTFEYTGTLPSGIGLTSAGAFFGVPDVGTGALPLGTAYTIYVRARDASGQASAQITLTLTVTISAPVVGATTPPNAVLGATYSHTLTASGGRGPYAYSLVSGSLPTGLALSASGVISGAATASASCPANAFVVKATDALGQNSANATKCIATSTGVIITNTSFNAIVVGSNYNGTVNASGGTTPYTFTATGLPSGVSLNASTGVLSGYVNDPVGSYTVFITVTDSSSPALTSTRTFTFKVRDPLSITTTSVPRAGAGSSYGPVTLNATGGETPYTFTRSSGSLPPGLSLSSSGVISGTLTSNAASGTSAYTFSVVVADAAGLTSATQSLTINVSVAPKIVRSRFPSAMVGTTYAYDVERAGGVNPFISAANLASQFTWAATGLPSGLTINAATGRISGTPAAGTDASSPYTVAVSVTDANGITGSRNVTLEVRAAALTLDLAAARAVDPCQAATVSNCEPNAYKIAALVPSQSTTKYMVHGVLHAGTTAAPTTARVYISRILSSGHMATPGASVYSVYYTPTTAAAWITGLDVADIDNDTYPDIVFADRTNNKIVVVWNSGTVDGNGMPVFSAENSFAMPASGNKPYQVKIASVRPDTANANKKDLIVSDYDLLTPATAARVAVFLAQDSCSANCSGARATLYTGTGASITAYNTTLITPAVGLIYIGGIDVGYFNTAPGPTVCPSLVVTGRRASGSNDDYIFLRHQSYSGGCTGNFSTHASSDEKLVITANTNGIPGIPAVADLNNDGISDIAVPLRWTAIANSAAVKIFMMPGGNAFPASPINPLLPTKSGTNYVASAVIPYCLDGSTTCSYPSLMVAGGRDRPMVITAATATAYGFLSILPNQGSSPWFEDLTGNNRIDYYAPPGIGANGIMATPLVTSNKNDVAFMGVDNNALPYYYMVKRNGSSTTDPLRQMRLLRSLPSYLGTTAEVGTMKLTDMNSDGLPDLGAHYVNQASIGMVVGSLTGNDQAALPDPTYNPIGSNFGLPNTWHYQDTMDTADFDEDGYPDYVTAGNTGRALTVNFGDGTSTIANSFMIEPGISGELYPRAVAAADFDNDGHQDIISLNYNNTTALSSFSFFKGNGNGTFNAASEFLLANALGCADARAMKARDLNGDGRPELAVLCYVNQALWILRRHTDGTWIRNSGLTVNTSGGANGTVLAMGRLTSTTGTDFVVGGLDVTNSYRLITGLQLGAPDAAGNFTVSASLNPYQTIDGYLSSAEITDLNNDSYGDIILTPASQAGLTTFAATFVHTCRTTAPGACTDESWGGDGVGLTSIAVGDLNNDGKMDFFYGSRTGARIFERMISRILNISF